MEEIFLERRLIMKKFFTGKSILITGGVGSIGSHLLKQLLTFEPKVIRVLDNNEYKLFELSQKHNQIIRPLLGDIRDFSRLKKATEHVDIVFHAAALKHVELSEFNPFEVVKTNVLGTQNILQAALESNVEKLILISTDKAANPINTMGATKLLAEKLTVSASYHKGTSRTKFAAVRFGNVLGSNGSAAPLWLDQIEKNQEITITDSNMTRFVMSPHHAIDLILRATIQAEGGEVFILKMPSVRVIDLAKALIALYQSSFPGKNTDIGIKEIGIKIGEKIHEELVVQQEVDHLFETDGMYVLQPHAELLGLKMIHQQQKLKKVPSDFNYSSETNNYLDQEAIIKLLKESSIL